MAVPNTNDFTLQDVIDEVGPVSDDLQECFLHASEADFDDNYKGTKNSLLNFRNYGALPPPTCPNEIIVFQICNSNSAIDDNFNIYLNDTFLGLINLNQNAQIGAVFIGSTNTALTLTDANTDFVCPMAGMDVYFFDPVIIASSNVIEMVTAQSNNNGNVGTIAVRSYIASGNLLITPYLLENYIFSGTYTVGSVAGSFTFNFTTCPPRANTVAPSPIPTLSLTDNRAFEPPFLTLSWSASVDDEGDVVRYSLEKKIDNGSWELFVLTTDLTFDDFTITSAGTPVYNYRIRAVDNASNFSGYSNTVSIQL